MQLINLLYKSESFEKYVVRKNWHRAIHIMYIMLGTAIVVAMNRTTYMLFIYKKVT